MSYLIDLQVMPYRAGVVTVGSLITTQFVNFSSNFPNTNYTPTLTISGASNTTCILSSQGNTISGFQLNLAAGIVAGTNVNYICWLNN